MRKSGILCPIFSISSQYGIGSFSKEAYEFVDFLKESKQGYWQILPVGPTGYGNSPYQPVSAYAGNPYFIDPVTLIEEGLLTWEDCNACYFGSEEERVDYGALYENRLSLLRKAYMEFTHKQLAASTDYLDFCQANEDWLEDYCLFCVLKDLHQGDCWQNWEDEYKFRKPEALATIRNKKADDLSFYRFVQYTFTCQWDKLRAYANEKEIKIIGDIPFYVSLDSSDVWANPDVFLMDEDLNPTVVAGCPPDAFSPTGQLWGNPIYDWDSLKEQKYHWWIRRFARSYELYDVIRIDHFHGFMEYYAVPYGDETAEKGTLHKGVGLDFFQIVAKETGDFITEDGFRIIAEDLGAVTKENQQFLMDTGIPGMKILQYAFTGWDSIYMPYKLNHNCVVYTGTHDNMPTRPFIDTMNQGSKDYMARYMNSANRDSGALTWDLIREAYRSVADLCIIPIQDYLCKGEESRINTPGAPEGNWQWRLKPHFLSGELAHAIRELCDTYAR